MTILKTLISDKFIAHACSLIIIFTGIWIFGKNIFPLLSDNQQLQHNLSILSFDLNVTIQEICAYFLLVVGASLISRSRISWIVAIVFLIICLISNIVIARQFHYTDITPITTATCILLVCYKYFNKPLYLSYSFVFICAFIVFAICYGTFGSYILRSEFSNLETLGDAFYFSIVTFSTVGYGDILPKTHLARYFVSSMIVIGLIMFTSGITFIAFMINSKIKNMLVHFNKGKVAMTNHIVVIGYNILAKLLITRYNKEDIPYLVIDDLQELDSDRQLLLDNNKLLKSSYPGEAEVLAQARANEAKLIIVSFDRDADTIFALMNVHEYLQKFEQRPNVLARIIYQENIEKAKTVGADKVIAPHLMVADAIVDYLKEGK